MISIMAVGALAGSFLALVTLVWEIPGLVDLDRDAERLRRSERMDAILADGAPLGFSVQLPANTVVQLGEPKIVVPAALLLALLALAWRDRIGGLVAVTGPGLTGALTQYLLKPLINLPIGHRAFPSGHAGGVAAVALVVLIVVYRRWGWLPALVVAPLVVVPALMVGAALLRLDYHYPTDVLGGALLAATMVLGLMACLTLYRGPGHQHLRSGPPIRGGPLVRQGSASR